MTQLSVVLPVLVIVNDCGAGFVPCNVVKFSALWFKLMAAERDALTVRDTATGLVKPPWLKLSVPWYGRGLSIAALTLTVTFIAWPGCRFPLEGVALSQFAPSKVVAARVQAKDPTPLC